MSLNYFDSPQRINELRARPSGALLEGFAEKLWLTGYAKVTGRYHIRAAEHLMH